ncbi:MAG TPA: OsmC family protein [Kofleriaceae bacterium]|jgi:organic hydroperoxide reductase OsmC/OhrA
MSANRVHSYAARIVWQGNTGEGTANYAAYGRDYATRIAGKPELAGSADPAFRGDASRHNPEDLFLAAIAACHMLFYLALCARRGVRVVAYEDAAEGVMETRPDGGGAFTSVVLRPRVTIAVESAPNRAGGTAADLAAELHATAHSLCFIGNSCRMPIRVAPVIDRLDEENGHAGPDDRLGEPARGIGRHG